MSLAGKGIVAIWHDIVPEGRPEFYEWHNREHMPERMSIPGFRRGRRYISIDNSSPMVFCFYEAESLNVVGGSDYLQRLNNPSEWTRRMMPYFRNMSRSVCSVRYSEGVGEGGFVATLRLDNVDDQRLCSTVLPDLLKLPCIVGVHLCVADEATSNIPTLEKTFRQTTDVCAPGVVIIEGASADSVQFAGQKALADLKSGGVGIYHLENTRSNLPGTY